MYHCFDAICNSCDFVEGEGNQEKGLQLSIEGHVQDLISEATDERNLARMYVGWAAFF